MSSPELTPDSPPLIVLVHAADRAFQDEMVHAAVRRGYGARPAHNAVFATLSREGSRASDMAHRAGITKQSMGEVVRELVDLGLLEMKPDPDDRRAKLVTFTEVGLEQAMAGRRHLVGLEREFVEEFGDETYQSARRILLRVTEILAERAKADESAESLGA
ncbi:MAG: MarR family winged helix-turn-helix transcriptional regulator [Aeromicrobium sp.]